LRISWFTPEDRFQRAQARATTCNSRKDLLFH
jgi:hypothetical protein